MNPSNLRDAVKDLRRAIRSVLGAYGVIVGGLAVQEWGYERFTRDLDAVIDAASYRDVLDAMRSAGYKLSRQGFLTHGALEIEVDLLKEGSTIKGSREPVPSPRTLGPNCGFATLAGIIHLKLIAGRRQDLADVVGLLKIHHEKAGEIKNQLPPFLERDFLSLLQEAEAERRC